MGLLSKANPKATARSVIIHSLFWGVIGLVLWFISIEYQWPYPEVAIAGWRSLVGFVLVSSFLGGLSEWQYSDD